MFRRDEAVKELVLEEMELTAKEMVNSKFVSKKVTSSDEAQQKNARLQRVVKTSEEQSAVPKMLRERVKVKREERWSGSESSDETSSQETSR